MKLIWTLPWICANVVKIIWFFVALNCFCITNSIHLQKNFCKNVFFFQILVFRVTRVLDWSERKKLEKNTSICAEFSQWFWLWKRPMSVVRCPLTRYTVSFKMSKNNHIKFDGYEGRVRRIYIFWLFGA